MPRALPWAQHVVGRARRAVHERRAAPGTSPVDVGALIAPLRYDVVVRARLFDLLAEHAHLSADALVEAAAGTAYARWFEDVECARYFPELLRDDTARRQRFAARVSGAARLLRSFEHDGFDAASPVTLIAAPAGSVSDSGVEALGPLHIGDGCHRLALLLRAGVPLEAWMYKVRASLGPLVDNTAVLLRAGAVEEADYVSFLGGRFPVGRARSIVDAVAHVEAVDPRAAVSLRALVAAQWHPAGR